MACYKVFGFLIILKESFKLLHKNGKLFASIAFISLLLASIFVVLFGFSFESLTDNVIHSPRIDSQDEFKYFALLLVLEVVFVLGIVAIFHLLGVATTLVSSASYSGQSLSLQDLFSSIRRTWKKPLSLGFHSSRPTTRYALLVVVVLVALLVAMKPNAITIFTAVFLGVVAYVYNLYEAVVLVLAFVVLVVEDAPDRNGALEKAEEVVEGRRLQGFLLNLFFQLILVIVLCSWMIVGDTSLLDLMGYALFVINVASLLRILVLMAFTVFYFQCKKHHGEEVAVLGKSMYYSKLPISDVV